MNFNFQDPAILISLGVILIAGVLLLVAVGKLFKKSTAGEGAASQKEIDDFLSSAPLAPEPTDTYNQPFAAPNPSDRMPFSSPHESAPAVPALSKDMVDRLESMSQRLNDMQGVLQKQATVAAAGTPLTPETIDKLLKIISNVAQQVDILQRNMGTTPAGPAIESAPVAEPKNVAPVTPPQPIPNPASFPAGGITPGGKPIGVVGGALSMPRPPGQKPPPTSTTPPVK